MKPFVNKSLKILLLAFLVIFPFSYNEVSNKWNILFVLTIFVLIYIHFAHKTKQINLISIKIISAILMMMIFGFAEKINFIHEFNILIEANKRIPLSTLLLSIILVFFLIKNFQEDQKIVSEHQYIKSFILTCIFLFVISILFYPIFYSTYSMKMNSTIQLFNNTLKYLLIFIVTSNYIADYKIFKQLNLFFIISLSITVILSILL